MDQQTLVVVGNGMVGFRLCRQLVECGAAGGGLRVVVFGEEPRPAYDRIRLTEMLAGASGEDLTLAPRGWYEDHGIELFLADPVVALDRQECAVRAASGREVLFDRLVLATGSRPFVPPIPGADLPGVLVYRTVADLEALREGARTAGRAAVIGGGLLGLEAARAMLDLGLEVHVIEASGGLLPRQLDEAGAALLRREIEALGVRVETGRRTRRIDGGAGGPRVLSFDGGGGDITADLVVLAAGVRPRGELARAAGLTLDANGGVAVDDHLASSDARIFAVGECASHRGATYGLAAPGYRMIDVLVDNLVGGGAAFAGADRSTRLKLLGVSVASLGRHDEKETPGSLAHVFAGNGVYRKLVVHEGRIIGALAVGPWDDIERVREAIAEPVRFSFWDLRRFRGTGTLWLRSESPPVHEWPADAIVCGCTGVRRGALADAEIAGACTVAELGACTGAGTACGSCKPLLADFLRRVRVESLPPGSHRDLCGPASSAAPRSAPSSALRLPDLASLPGPASSRLLRLPPVPPPSSGLDSGDVETPPTLRSDGTEPLDPLPVPLPPARDDDAEPSSSPLSLPPPRAAFDTLMSATERFCGPAEAGDAPLVLSGEGAAVKPSLLPLPVDVPPSSGPLSMPPSSRRDSMAPLRSITVPPEQRARLASLVPTSSPGGHPPAPEPHHRRPMLAVAGVAVAGSLAIALVPAVPPAASFRGPHLDDLVAGRAAKQVSGWAVIALALGVGALSLRKRWARFSLGDVPALRLAHAAAGAAALLALAVHTGLRAGARADRLLFLDFLALSIGGGVAAAATALARRFHPAVAEARRNAAYRVHLALFLPFPVLVALHVLRAYWY